MALSKSLTRIAQRYARLSKVEDTKETTLFIQRVSEGSLIVDLTPLSVAVGSIASLPDSFKTAIDFVRGIKSIIEFFLSRGERPAGITSKDCDEIREIVQPIAIQKDGFFNIQATHDSSVVVNVSLNSVESNAVQNRAILERDRLKDPAALTDPLIFQTTEKVCVSALFCMTISPNLFMRGRNRGSGIVGISS